MEKKFIGYGLYDGRYKKNPERAVMYLFCETLDEARRERDGYGDDTVIVKLYGNNKKEFTTGKVAGNV